MSLFSRTSIDSGMDIKDADIDSSFERKISSSPVSFGVVKELLNGSLPAPRPLESFPEGLWSVIESCWTRDADLRPSAAIVSQWLQEIEATQYRSPSIQIINAAPTHVKTNSPSDLNDDLYRPQNMFSSLHHYAITKIPELDAILGFSKELPQTALTAVISGRQYREQVNQAIMQHHATDFNNRREAISQDEPKMLGTLKDLLADSKQTTTALGLSEEESNVLMQVLKDIYYDTALAEDLSFIQNVGGLLIKLTKRLIHVNEDLFVSGVNVMNKSWQGECGGSFGDIFRGKYCGDLVALKRLRVRGPEANSVYKNFFRESSAWHRLDHPYILPFLGVDAESFPGQPCMVSPWMIHGTVTEFIQKNPTTNLVRIIYEIVQGMEYLDSSGVVHGDIKGANILIDAEIHPRIADFGLSVLADVTRRSTKSQAGTARFMAPELWNPTQFNLDHYTRTFSSDVYAFACLCVEIYTGKRPWHNVKEEILVQMRVVNGDRPQRPDGQHAMPDGLWAAVEMCWAHDPSLRPRAGAVAQRLEGLVSDGTVQV